MLIVAASRSTNVKVVAVAALMLTLSRTRRNSLVIRS